MKVLFLHTPTWELVLSFKFKLFLCSLLGAQIKLSHCFVITWITNDMSILFILVYMLFLFIVLYSYPFPIFYQSFHLFLINL